MTSRGEDSGVSGSGTCGGRRELLKRLPAFVDNARSADPTMQLEGTRHIRYVTCIGIDAPFDEVLATGVAPLMVEFLSRHDTPKLQFEAAWVLSNICSGTMTHTMTVLNHGALEPLVNLLTSPDEDVSDQVVWALGNIAVDSLETRDMVLAQGGLPLILRLLDQHSRAGKVPQTRHAVWALSNLCRRKPGPPFEQVCPAIDVLCQLLEFKDDDVVVDALWGLSHIVGGSSEGAHAVVTSGSMPIVLRHLCHGPPRMQSPALVLVGQFARGGAGHLVQVVDAGVLPLLIELLAGKTPILRSEACGLLASIATGGPSMVQLLLDVGAVSAVVTALCGPRGLTTPPSIRRATTVLANALLSGTPDHTQVLRDLGAFDALHTTLANPVKKKAIVFDALETLLQADELAARRFAWHMSDCGIVELLHVIAARGGVSALRARHISTTYLTMYQPEAIARWTLPRAAWVAAVMRSTALR